MVFTWVRRALLPRPAPAPPDAHQALERLGFLRVRLLDSLGGPDKRAIGYFPLPGEEEDVFELFRAHIQRLHRDLGGHADPLATSLLAAGRLLLGDLSGADAILDALPDAPTTKPYGVRYVPLTPMRTLSAVLPWPEALRDHRRWAAEAVEEEALRAWLRWAERDGRYDLAP